MNFDNLGQAWRKAHEAGPTTEQCERRVALSLWRLERVIGLTEAAMDLFFIYFFGALMIDDALGTAAFPLAVRLGAFVLVLAAGRRAYHILRFHFTSRRSDFNASVRRFFQRELGRIDKEIEQLESKCGFLSSEPVLFVLPVYVGLSIMRFGWHGPTWDFAFSFALYTLFAVLFVGGVATFNHYAVHPALIARRVQLQQHLDNLDPSETSD